MSRLTCGRGWYMIEQTVRRLRIIKKIVFGTLDGVEIIKYTLTCAGVEADIMTYGATLTALRGEIWDGGYSAAPAAGFFCR